MSLIGDSEFAVSESVPELNSAITRAGDDLAVVCGEGNGENVVAVANEAARSGTSRKLP